MDKEIATKVTMTLKEITDLLETRHDNAMRIVEKMMENQEFGKPTQIEEVINRRTGSITIKTYQLNKRQSIAVASRLNTPYLMRLIDRLEELEATPTIPLWQQLINSGEALKQKELELEKSKKRRKMLFEEFTKHLAIEGLRDFKDTADIINKPNFSRTNLMKLLREKGWLCKSNKPSRSKLENGIFERRVFRQDYLDGTFYKRDITLVTEKGVVAIIELINKQPTLPPPPNVQPYPPLKMIVEPLDVEAWLDAGWTFEMLIDQGKAVYH